MTKTSAVTAADIDAMTKATIGYHIGSAQVLADYLASPEFTAVDAKVRALAQDVRDPDLTRIYGNIFAVFNNVPDLVAARLAALRNELASLEPDPDAIVINQEAALAEA